MDFEPEYISVNAAGTKAFVTLQEANALGVLDLGTNSFSKVVGLGTKDFSAAGNAIDTNDKKDLGSLKSVAVKGLYQPDGIAAYQAGGQTYLVMANEGDTREDDGDKARASTLGATGDLARLNISTTDSTAGNLVTFGGRSFSIRDENGNLVFDSGNRLDAEAISRGIYDDGRSDDKGVEPEGVTLKEIGGRTYAFIGLERTTKGAVAIYDVTDPANASFVDMIVTTGDLAPEGITTFTSGGAHYLAIANEVSGTTTVYAMAPVPEPETYALLLAGLGLIGFMARRRRD
jgi:DNA-binding beta-propeller fold protein YncE